MRIIGLEGDMDFIELADLFRSKGIEAAVMDPMHVFGSIHIESAMIHAKRSFDNGTNRSKTMLTEFLLYMAGERQISKAMSAMKPKDGQNAFVVAFFDDVDDSVLKDIPMTRCDSLIEGTEEKAELLGLKNEMNIPCDLFVLEMVAMVDVLKG